VIIERTNTVDEGNLKSVARVLESFAARNQLTPREREMAGLLLVYGYSNKELAEHCDISVKTVKNHLDNMMRKLEIHSTRKLYSLLLQSFYEEEEAVLLSIKER